MTCIDRPTTCGPVTNGFLAPAPPARNAFIFAIEPSHSE
jgi:hypothetical protein